MKVKIIVQKTFAGSNEVDVGITIIITLMQCDKQYIQLLLTNLELFLTVVRRGQDLNLRELSLTRFPSVRLKPLGHLS